MEANKVTYNRAKTWQIGLFAFNNTATNLYMFLMIYVSFYASNVGGMLVATVGVLLTSMRIFDGITDPIIGFIIDKTNTKFGKFRPAMILGNVIMACATLVLYSTLDSIPESMKVLYFIAVYGVYIIGYTFQTACTKAAQACLTSDPEQRPVFTLFDSIYNTVVFTGGGIYVASYLVGKYGDFTQELFNEFVLTAVILSAVLTVLAVIGIAGKDRVEFFGLGSKTPVVKFKDYLDVIKNNRAIQMLIFAASTDKLASTTMSNVSVTMIIYGVVAGNYALSGAVGGYSMIPTLIIVALGVQFARKMGQKQAIVLFTWIPMLLSAVLGGMILFGDMTSLNVTTFNFFTIAYIVVLTLMNGTRNVSGAIVIPMIADCADYETYRSGKYVPGMMGTLFSFVDKLISSLATSIVAFTLAGIGFTTTLPTIDTPFSNELLYIGVFLMVGMPVIGWICSLIAMKFYPLTKEKMDEIQVEIENIKKSA